MATNHTLLSTTDVEHARKALVGLLWDCPVGHHPTDCPLHEYRQGALDDRHKWARSLSDEVCVKVYEYHQQCMSRKIDHSSCKRRCECVKQVAGLLS